MKVFVEVGKHRKRLQLKVQRQGSRLVVVKQSSAPPLKRRTRPRRNSPAF